MTDWPTAVYHFGPSARSVGGIASVIDTLVRLELGADMVHSVPTWQPGSKIRSGALAARAAAGVLRLPPSAIAHVHLSEGGSFVREAAVLASAKLRGVPRVVTIHGYRFAAFSSERPRLVARVLGMADAITVLTESDGAVVQKLAPDVHVELLPNPVSLDLDAGPVSKTREVVLFAGEVGRRKGADVLHRAWQSVSASRPMATCIIVGPATGLTLPALERLEVRGAVSQGCVRKLIRDARVVALPSRGEALPMILSEAMAAGRPFVSTPAGGVRSLAAGGLLVPIGDDDALGMALIELLSDPDRAQGLGSAGQTLCERSMAPEVVDSRLRKLYASLTNAQR
jgi:glycosyltransferase involved in cell wall biosynthesis